MSEFFGTVIVATMAEVKTYKVCFSDQALSLKCQIERDYGIPIKEAEALP